LSEYSLNDTGADTELFADLEDAVPAGPQLQYSRFDRGFNSASAELCAVRPGASKPSINSFSNDPSLKLSEYAKQLKHRFACGRGSIESLLVKEQTYTLS